MNEEHLHTVKITKTEKTLFKGGDIQWDKTQEQVWAELQLKIADKPVKVVPLVRHHLIQWSAVAVLIFVVGLLGLVSSYNKTVECRPGEHLLVALPDGSTVDLNADSKLTYYPLKWKLERKLRLEGEAYFNVKKGKKFFVISESGTVRVLGTSFNIFAREKQYRVTCLTGKVQVNSGKENQVTLLPQNRAELEEGKLVVSEMFQAEKVISWRNNQFIFEGRPLKEVIDEIERQYAVTIKLSPELDKRNFGSNFSKKHSVEEVLDFVCRPMNLKFVKQSENVYLVVEKS